MRICYTSDLHGSERHYRQLTDLVRAARPDLLILGGDLFPDGPPEDPAPAQVAFVRESFLPLARGWRRELPSLRVACILGNHDWAESERFLTGRPDEPVTLLAPGRSWKMGGVHFLGYPCSPPAPFWAKEFERLDQPGDPLPAEGGVVYTNGAPRRVSAAEHFLAHPTIQAELAALKPPAAPWIFVCHAPPHDTLLDRLPNLESPIGSKAVRAFIERHKPLCALHGHAHESPTVSGAYADEVGGALCVNPGQDPQRLFAALFDTADPRGTLRHTVLGA